MPCLVWTNENTKKLLLQIITTQCKKKMQLEKTSFLICMFFPLVSVTGRSPSPSTTTATTKSVVSYLFSMTSAVILITDSLLFFPCTPLDWLRTFFSTSDLGESRETSPTASTSVTEFLRFLSSIASAVVPLHRFRSRFPAGTVINEGRRKKATTTIPCWPPPPRRSVVSREEDKDKPRRVQSVHTTRRRLSTQHCIHTTTSSSVGNEGRPIFIALEGISPCAKTLGPSWLEIKIYLRQNRVRTDSESVFVSACVCVCIPPLFQTPRSPWSIFSPLPTTTTVCVCVSRFKNIIFPEQECNSPTRRTDFSGGITFLSVRNLLIDLFMLLFHSSSASRDFFLLWRVLRIRLLFSYCTCGQRGGVFSSFSVWLARYFRDSIHWLDKPAHYTVRMERGQKSKRPRITDGPASANGEFPLQGKWIFCILFFSYYVSWNIFSSYDSINWLAYLFDVWAYFVMFIDWLYFYSIFARFWAHVVITLHWLIDWLIGYIFIRYLQDFGLTVIWSIDWLINCVPVLSFCQ